jgi:hypothetical protein
VGKSNQLSRGAHAARLAQGAADWLTDATGSDPRGVSLYHGLAGILLALHEAAQQFGDDRYRLAVGHGADALGAAVDASMAARCTSG